MSQLDQAFSSYKPRKFTPRTPQAGKNEPVEAIKAFSTWTSLRASPGDWILRDKFGNYTVLTAHAFDLAYAEVIGEFSL